MKVLVDKDFLEDGLELICDKIRLKTGGTGVLAFPVEIAQAVETIETGSGGITPTGTKTIRENGEGIDVTTFAAVDVAVPIPAGPSGKITITANGTGIDVAQYAEADVAVPTGTDTSDATAVAGDIRSGKTAYGANGKITGTLTEQAQTFDAVLTQDSLEIEVQDVVIAGGSVTGIMLYAVSGVAADQEGTIYIAWSYPGIGENKIGVKEYIFDRYYFSEKYVGRVPIQYNALTHVLNVRVSGNTQEYLRAGSYKLIVW